MSKRPRFCSFTTASVICVLLYFESAIAHGSPVRALRGSCGRLPKAEVNEFGFAESPLGYRVEKWFPVDLDGDGTWEIAASTGPHGERIGVFDPASAVWLTGPDSVGFGQGAWTPLDRSDNAGFEYAYFQNGEIRLCNPLTGTDELLWELPYTNLNEVIFWGNGTDGLPLVLVVTSDYRANEEPYSMRYTHELLSGRRTSSSSGTAGARYVIQAYPEISSITLAIATRYMYYDTWSEGPDWGHGWKGIDLIDQGGVRFERLVYWSFFGQLFNLDLLLAPVVLNVQVVRHPGNLGVLVLHHELINLSNSHQWYLDRVTSQGYTKILQWNSPRSEGVAFDLFNEGIAYWLFPLATPAWERRRLVDGVVFDTVPGPAAAALQVGPLLNLEHPNLFYVEDSTLYIYQPEIPTGVFDDPVTPQAPMDPITIAAHPNPFNSAVTLTWPAAAAATSLTIYNVLGQAITSIRSDGRSEFTWDGCDSQSHQCPSGIYIAQVASHDFTASTKIVLLR